MRKFGSSYLYLSLRSLVGSFLYFVEQMAYDDKEISCANSVCCWKIGINKTSQLYN